MLTMIDECLFPTLIAGKITEEEQTRSPQIKRQPSEERELAKREKLNHYLQDESRLSF